MIPLVTFAITGLVVPSSQQDLAAFDKLLRDRSAFDSKVQDTDEFIGYTTVHSEMLGGAHSEALFPIGSASERYIVSYDEARHGGTLMYQKLHGKAAIVEWHVRFVPVEKKTAVKGTIRRFLMSDKYAISSKARLTAAIRKQLDSEGPYAGYSYHPMMGGYAWVTHPDGTSTEAVQHGDMYTITVDEIELLLRRRTR